MVSKIDVLNKQPLELHHLKTPSSNTKNEDEKDKMILKLLQEIEFLKKSKHTEEPKQVTSFSSQQSNGTKGKIFH